MGIAYFISHPEVIVDRQRPVPNWRLSDQGIARMRAFACSPEMRNISTIWSSRETKAIEAAGLLAGDCGLPVNIEENLHENDRSATGFLPPHEFEATANAFFARPSESVRGWEKAIDAQARIIAAFNHVLATSAAPDIAIVAHGGVGTLLLCHLMSIPIDRKNDQDFQGHYWTFDLISRKILHAWLPIAPR